MLVFSSLYMVSLVGRGSHVRYKVGRTGLKHGGATAAPSNVHVPPSPLKGLVHNTAPGMGELSWERGLASAKAETAPWYGWVQLLHTGVKNYG